jgi:hypothetical protein
VPIWARLIVAIASARIAVGLVVFLAGQVDTTVRSPIPVWAYALLSATFALVGVGLVVGNKRDARAAWLGGMLVLLAGPTSQQLLRLESGPPPAVIMYLQPATFLAAFLWRFVGVFPSPMSGRAGVVAGVASRLLEVIGAAAFTLVLSQLAWPLTETDLRRALIPAEGGSVFWPITFVAGLAAIATLAFRLRRSAGSDRFRLQVFAAGLAFGLAPLFVEVIVEESWPAYKAFVHQPAIEPWVAIPLFVPMATLPFVVAFSVLYDRIVETRVVLRLAAQYFLARATIISLTAMPFVALAVFLYQRRTESLVALLGGPRPIALAAIVVAGGMAFRLRWRWLQALDRRYFREPHDAQALLSHLLASDWITQTPRAIAETLARELEGVFHARADLFVLDSGSGDLRDPRGDAAVLNVRSTLATLVRATPQPMDADAMGEATLSRIPAPEQAWLQAGPYALLVPVRTRSVELIGILALSRKRSELAYSESDRRALMAIATPVALALENNRLRSGTESTPPAAGECVSCSRVHEAGARSCSCGGSMIEAAAPYLLRGVYRFEQRLGAGGMGVVYLARDLSLDRAVAIKTLPQVGSKHQTRLRSEAQAMASIVDGNLAVIYGIEWWRGVPFIVEEYLESGTLAHRLVRGAMPIPDAVDLGITLAATLGRLHEAGIVHCDIKPSNIGFSRAGTPKLIDFGLAHMLQSSVDPMADTRTIGEPAAEPADDDSRTLSTIVTRHGLVGTPPYMSPEALRASKPDPSFDVWALSVVLFEAIAGRRPFLGRTFSDVSLAIFAGDRPDIRQLRPDCGDHAAGFFARALAAVASTRPRTAQEMHAELLALRGALQ